MNSNASNRLRLQIHKFSIRWIRSAIRSLHIVEEENTWMPGIIAKMIIVVFYLIIGFALLENFGWEMGTFKVWSCLLFFFQNARSSFFLTFPLFFLGIIRHDNARAVIRGNH